MTRGAFAVVGAGMAGMTAARELAKAGHEVAVFDKARGVGGRMPTRRHETGAFDHGAQYFTARTPAFRAQVEDWGRRGVAALWEGRVVRLEAGRAEREGDSPPRYVGVPRMSVLARDLAGDLAVHCSQHVAHIERDESGWRLVTREDEAHGPFDAVVLATPAPQTLPLLPRLGAAERFVERIAPVEIDPCHALMVSFAEPLETGFEAGFVSASPLAWIARNSSKPGRPDGECWVLHASPEWSRAEVDLEPEKVAGRLLEALAEAVARPLPEALHVGHHRWLYARTRVACGEGPLWAPDEGVGVCGDWTIGNRVEDAFTSGLALASAVLQADPRNASASRRR